MAFVIHLSVQINEVNSNGYMHYVVHDANACYISLHFVEFLPSVTEADPGFFEKGGQNSVQVTSMCYSSK